MVYKARRIKIDGNIFVQFIIHSLGLLLASLVFIIEFHKRMNLCCNPVRIIFSFLIGNFLEQIQKALLLGSKFLYGKETF